MQMFDDAYARLNDAQKKAVDTIEGPVMVVAGPGTGKTQVLSLRVANILKKTQVNPRNILCLTFTVSGATAMRERLRQLIGPAAYGVTINTVHGFCNDVIAQYPQVFEQFASLEQISDVEQVRALNAIIDRHMPDLELVSRKNPHGRTKDILARISEVKKEGISVERLQTVADQYEQEMAGKSREGTKAHEKNLAAARKFRDFVLLFLAYQEMLARTQRYDYDDMILHALRAFAEEDWLLLNLQERYLYVLVDEFQDLNGAQYAVIEQLITPRTPEDRPNIFVVGDDDQAIYRFQGANLQNILTFRDRFPDAVTVTLTTSYRCTQPILDAAGRLIRHNDERLVGAIPGLSKELTSGAETDGPEPQLIHSPSDAAEPWLIADVIEEELRRGTPPSEIAVLLQTNRELQPLYEVLRAREIPVRMDGKISLLDQPLVRQAITILRAVRDPSHNPYLCATLGIAVLGCKPADIGRLFQLSRERETPVQTLLLSVDDPASDLSALFWQDRDCLIRTRDILLELHQQLPNRSIVETVEKILKHCHLLPPPDAPGDPAVIAALQSFFEYVRQRSYEQKNTFALDHLLDDLALIAEGENGLRLLYALPHLSQEGVQLLTAHQSKGLEFDVVLLGNFRDGHWDRRRSPAMVSVPEELLFGRSSDQRSFEKRQDERRVAYVAMTRARRRLLFTCPDELTNGGSKPRAVSTSGFFVEAGPLPEEQGVLQAPEKISTLLYAPPADLDADFQSFLRERLEDFRLSVTALNHFLKDPQLFLERDLLQTPDLKSESLVFGNAAHHALKKWGMSVQQGTPIGRERLIDDLRNYLVEREILTEAQRRNLIKHGEEVLGRYYDEALTENVPHIFKIEFPINAYVDDIPLKGKIDRIDLAHPDSPRATIVDYKTGVPKTEKQVRDDGDYFRQLAFYALLLEHGMPILEPVAYALDFLGEGTEHPIRRTFTVSEEEKEELRRVIRAVWAKIQNLDFTPLDPAAGRRPAAQDIS